MIICSYQNIIIPNLINFTVTTLLVKEPTPGAREAHATCQYPHTEFHQGLPNIEDFDGKEPTLVIIDDLMQETNETVAKMFTKGSHHRNISVVFLTQNLFPKNKFARTMSRNAHYMVLFKNPRDVSQFANLARQMYPKTSRLPSKRLRRDAGTV